MEVLLKILALCHLCHQKLLSVICAFVMFRHNCDGVYMSVRINVCVCVFVFVCMSILASVRV